MFSRLESVGHHRDSGRVWFGLVLRRRIFHFRAGKMLGLVPRLSSTSDCPCGPFQSWAGRKKLQPTANDGKTNNSSLLSFSSSHKRESQTSWTPILVQLNRSPEITQKHTGPKIREVKWVEKSSPVKSGITNLDLKSPKQHPQKQYLTVRQQRPVELIFFMKDATLTCPEDLNSCTCQKNLCSEGENLKKKYSQVVWQRKKSRVQAKPRVEVIFKTLQTPAQPFLKISYSNTALVGSENLVPCFGCVCV
jgi:hypothetical protein